MTDSMVERVARVLCTAQGENPDTATPYNPHVDYLWQHYIPSARAAIEAMPKMDTRSEVALEGARALRDTGMETNQISRAIKVFQAMISAALAQPTGEKPAQGTPA